MPFFSGSFLAKPGLELKRERHSQRLVLGNALQSNLVFFFILKYIFKNFYLWLCWVFVATPGLSLVAASGASLSLRGTGFSLQGIFLLRDAASRAQGLGSRDAWA